MKRKAKRKCTPRARIFRTPKSYVMLYERDTTDKHKIAAILCAQHAFRLGVPLTRAQLRALRDRATYLLAKMEGEK